ncbi:MAG: Hsp20/alpha crystallin family protein [Chitinophagaceae bacterium]
MTVYSVNNRPVAKPFNYLFDELFNDYPAAFGKSVKSAVAPANISETLEAYQVELLVPGRNKEDFKISIEKGLLTISYEKKEEVSKEDSKNIRKEFSFNSFTRSFSLDEKVDTDNIQAKYENGLLKFYLPKKEQAKEVTRQISIQ